MKRVVVVSAVRTPIGSCGGSLRCVPAVNLAGAVLNQAVRNAEIDPGMVDDVIMGHVHQASNAVNSARTALLTAGWQGTVPGMSLDRRCCSGLDAVFVGVMKVQTGNADIVVAGGMESMSQAGPLYHADPPAALKAAAIDAAAKLMGISRQKADQWALRSHQKAVTAIHSKRFESELTAVIPDLAPPQQHPPVAVDELPDPGLTMACLSRLEPFSKGGICTIGNSAALADGAAAVVLMSEEKAHKLGILPLAYFRSSAVAAMNLERAYSAVPRAVGKALKLANLRLDDVELIEVQELYAAQTLVDLAQLEIPADEIEQRVNVNGSGIALGNPLAATGTLHMVSLIHEMRRRRVNFALQTLCGAGGQGICTILEGYQL